MSRPDLGRGSFRAAFEHAPVGLALINRAGHRIVLANRALGDLLGVDPQRMVGRSISHYRQRTDGREPDSWRGGEQVPGFSGERACRRADGSTVWVEVHTSALPERDDDGEALCLVHVVDVSRRRAADAARERRQAWASALGEIRLAVLLGAQSSRSLSLVCHRARMLLGASDAVVMVPSPDGQSVTVRAADGHDAEPLVDTSIALPDTVAGRVLPGGRAVVTGPDGEPRAVIDHRLPPRGRGEVLALPLRTPDVVIGVLGLLRPSGQPFGRTDIDVARSFADQAAAALHIGELRADRERLRVLEDRERIARDLHDSVIQDLFAAGMALDSVKPLLTAPVALERVAATVDQLDETIKQIRSTIFELETADPGREVDLLRRVVDARADQLGFVPSLDVDGDLDDAPPAVVDHVLGIVSESLSNIARHAEASKAGVRLQVAPSGALILTVGDDGAGYDPATVRAGNGLANMRRRAELLGAELTIHSSRGGGTTLVLRVPANRRRAESLAGFPLL